MNDKPTYRFEIKSKRTGKKVRHFLHNEDCGLYNSTYSEVTDQRAKDMAFGMVLALSNDKSVYIEVYRLNGQGGYDLIHTQC